MLRRLMGSSQIGPARGWLIPSLASLSLVACVSHQVVSTDYEDISTNLSVEDRVEVLLVDGQSFSFLIKEIRRTEFVGDTRTNVSPGKIVIVPYEDIKKLELTEQNTAATAGLFFGLPVLFVIIVLTFFFVPVA